MKKKNVKLNNNRKKIKFNKLSNSLNIKLIKGDKKNIQYMVDYINKGKKLQMKPIYLSNKNKCTAYCSKLPSEILSYSSYIDFEKMKTVSSIVEKNEYKLLGTKSKKKWLML